MKPAHTPTPPTEIHRATLPAGGAFVCRRTSDKNPWMDFLVWTMERTPSGKAFHGTQPAHWLVRPFSWTKKARNSVSAGWNRAYRRSTSP